jgi:hypothetical protein
MSWQVSHAAHAAAPISTSLSAQASRLTACITARSAVACLTTRTPTKAAITPTVILRPGWSGKNEGGLGEELYIHRLGRGLDLAH